MNGVLWDIKMVSQFSPKLVDRTGNLTVGTTDPNDHTVYLSDSLKGDFLMRVLIHELGHCLLVSYDLIEEIHKMVKMEYWIQAEEFICNILADYGLTVYSIAFKRLGYKAWRYIPGELEKLVG